jgi:hypothetical protein
MDADSVAVPVGSPQAFVNTVSKNGVFMLSIAAFFFVLEWGTAFVRFFYVVAMRCWVECCCFFIVCILV